MPDSIESLTKIDRNDYYIRVCGKEMSYYYYYENRTHGTQIKQKEKKKVKSIQIKTDKKEKKCQY